MLYHSLLLLASAALASCDVSHLDLERSTPEPPPKPYAFSYTAGRYPGHADRHHAEVSDGSGVVRGTFSYLDPRQKLRQVDYVADREGFHPILNEAPPDHPTDSEAVARAKDKHYQLYAQIAQQHYEHPHPDGLGRLYKADRDGFLPMLNEAPPDHPTDSEAVARAKDKHYQLYAQIAQQHYEHPHPDESSVPRQSAAVVAAAAKHAQLFKVIAEQHARIAAEREALQREEEEKQQLQELGH